MKNGRSFVQTLVAVAVGALILAAGPAWAAQEIRGKVSIESWSVAAGLGFPWGNGVLEYRGGKYLSPLIFHVESRLSEREAQPLVRGRPHHVDVVLVLHGCRTRAPTERGACHGGHLNTSPFANTFATPTSTMLNAVTATEC